MSAHLTKNIWAVGRNFSKHAIEMNAEIPTEPFFFLKSGGCINTSSKINLPAWSAEIHHEIEMAFWVDENLSFSHISLALDLTARDAQNVAKAKSLPWTLAKSFNGACPLGPWISLNEISDLSDLTIQLFNNNQRVQNGHINQMIFKPLELLSYVKKHYPLSPHDIILTGTPEGVAKIQNNDSLRATLHSQNREILTCHWDVI